MSVVQSFIRRQSMKAYIYTTNDYGEYFRSPLHFGESLSGITAVDCDRDRENIGFIGFGVAITGSSCYNLSETDEDKREKLIHDLYSEDGLNLGIGRLTVAASDYSAEIYTYDDTRDDASLEHFSIERDREYIIPRIREILRVKPSLTIFASPWSPPAWMKTGGSIGGGFMRDKYVDCYADYFVKYIKAYRAEGIKISAVTPQNETETHQNGAMPACIWHPETEVKFIRALRKRLDENKLDVEIWMHDHNFSGVDKVDWCLTEYPELSRDCDGVAFHYYDGNIEQTAFLKERYDSLRLHFTEGGPRLYDNYATDWCKWTLMMIKVLCNGYSSFTGWNLMLDETGGPNVGPFFCGGLVTLNRQSKSLSYSGQYKALRHFSHITPDSRIYPLTFKRSKPTMSSFDRKGSLYTEGCLVEQPNGNTELILVNPSVNKEQLQYRHNGKVCYIEMLPNTSATVVFEN